MAKKYLSADSASFPSEFTELQIEGGTSAPTLTTFNGKSCINFGGGFNNVFFYLNSEPDYAITEKVEVVMLVAVNDNDATSNVGPALQLSGVDLAADGYTTYRTYQNYVWLSRYDSSSLNGLASDSVVDTLSGVVGSWSWARLQYDPQPDGSVIIRTRWWSEDRPEPLGWTLEYTVSSVDKLPNAGKPGLFIKDSTNAYIHSIGVGTAGDSAPRALPDTFFFDPNDWPVGATPATEGFPFEVLFGDFTIEIRNDGGATPNYMWFQPTTAQRSAVVYTPPYKATEIDLFIDETVTEVGGAERVGARINLDALGLDFYQYRDSAIDRVVDSALTQLVPAEPFNRYIRFRTQGVNPTSVKSRTWSTAGSEPTTWGAEVDDSTAQLQVEGYVGLTPFTSNKQAKIYGLGVGINGATAPTAPPGSVATPINLGVTNLQATSARLTWEQG